MAEAEELLHDEPGTTDDIGSEDIDDTPEFELEEESELSDNGSYSDDILNAEPLPETDLSLVETDNLISSETDINEFELEHEATSNEEVSDDILGHDEITEVHSNHNALSEEETESIELLLTDNDDNEPNDLPQAIEPTSSIEAGGEPQTVEKIDTEVVELQHSIKSLHQQQAHQLEMSLLERVDDLIQVLEKRHKPGHSPEQLPHKQFATALHYISNEKNHYLGAKWLRKAAMQGHGKAQLYLGMLFVQGNGVPKSLFHAYAWFSLAVCQNIDEAKDARKKLERHLTAKEINSSLRYAADLLDKIHHL